MVCCVNSKSVSFMSPMTTGRFICGTPSDPSIMLLRAGANGAKSTEMTRSGRVHRVELKDGIHWYVYAETGGVTIAFHWDVDTVQLDVLLSFTEIQNRYKRSWQKLPDIQRYL